MANILIVTWEGGQFSEQVYEGLTQIKKEGHDLFLLSDGRVYPPTDLFRSSLAVEFHRTSDVLDLIRTLRIRFDAVAMKSAEWLTPLVALIGSHFGVIGNSPPTAFKCRSKYHMRKALRAAGIPSVRFELCRSFQDIERAVGTLRCDCVAKPIGAHSSYGTFFIPFGANLTKIRHIYDASIRYLESKTEHGDVVRYSPSELKLLGQATDLDFATDYLVEEFLSGTEVSINSIVQRGKVNTLLIGEEIRMRQPYFVQLADRMPYVCLPEVENTLQDLQRSAVAALGITDSPVHTEVILTSEGPRIVEVACRIGGDNLHDAVFQITGYNLMYEAVKTALGEQRSYSSEKKCHIAAQYLLPVKSGLIKSIDVGNAIRSDPNITEVNIVVTPGDRVFRPPVDFSFLGYIQARGNTPMEAREHLQQALLQVKVTYV